MQSERTLDDHLIRLEKYLAQQNIASRREAKQLIIDGAISVNGTIVYEPGFGIDPTTDHVEIATSLPHKKTVLVYKPRGIETSKTDPRNQDIHDLFPELADLAPVGRLDKESQGLILLTNDGIITKTVTSKETDIAKEYIVTVRETVTDQALEMMSRGIMLDGIMTKPAETSYIDEHTFAITLHEGRKHQIRRMADACRLTIESLERIAIGSLSIDDLHGKPYVTLSQNHIDSLKKAPL